MNRTDYISGKPMPKMEVGAKVKLGRKLIYSLANGPDKKMFNEKDQQEWLEQNLDMRGVVLRIDEQDRVRVAAHIEWTYEGRSWKNYYYIEDLELVP